MADEGYLRESILLPQVKLVAGYQAIMPTFQGQVSEEGVMSLIEYIRTLAVGNRTTGEIAQITPPPESGAVR